MRSLVFGSALLATIASTSAQTPSATPRADAPLPSFEVASVKRNVAANARLFISSPPGRFTATNVPVRMLINSAYDLRSYQYVGIPDWDDRFDVVAKAPDGAAQDQTPLMVRSLLAERFKLVAHRETRESPIYALVMAHADRRLGPGLTRSTMDCGPILAERRAARGRSGAPVPVPQVVEGQKPVCNVRATVRQTPAGGAVRGYVGGNVTIARLADLLRGDLGRHVIDRTELMGEFDLELSYAPERSPSGSTAAGPITAPLDDGPSIFTALQEQLGLKLEPQRGPVEYLVIDRIEKPEVD
jgi:uncharacterized protein (TIGR03435 family)